MIVLTIYICHTVAGVDFDFCNTLLLNSKVCRHGPCPVVQNNNPIAEGLFSTHHLERNVNIRRAVIIAHGELNRHRHKSHAFEHNAIGVLDTTHGGNSVVYGVGGCRKILQIPVQVKARGAFGHRIKSRGSGCLNFH